MTLIENIATAVANRIHGTNANEYEVIAILKAVSKNCVYYDFEFYLALNKIVRQCHFCNTWLIESEDTIGWFESKVVPIHSLCMPCYETHISLQNN